MKRKNFGDSVKAHLSNYKEDVLKIKGKGTYRGREYAHILPNRDFRQNIIQPYLDSFFSSKYAKVKFHKGFSHLNSSQALCINFFFPLIHEEAHLALIRALGVKVTPPINEPEFEKSSNIENTDSRRTSFDFYFQSSRNEQVFVEVKYTENGFGAAKNDFEHREKFKKTYLPLLERSSFLIDECREREFFLKHYQILRNLVHIGGQSEVVLLFPKRNETVAKHAEAAQKFLNQNGQNKLHIVFLEDAVKFLQKEFQGKELGEYYKKFDRKYLAF